MTSLLFLNCGFLFERYILKSFLNKLCHNHTTICCPSTSDQCEIWVRIFFEKLLTCYMITQNFIFRLQFDFHLLQLCTQVPRMQEKKQCCGNCHQSNQIACSEKEEILLFSPQKNITHCLFKQLITVELKITNIYEGYQVRQFEQFYR